MKSHVYSVSKFHVALSLGFGYFYVFMLASSGFLTSRIDQPLLGLYLVAAVVPVIAITYYIPHTRILSFFLTAILLYALSAPDLAMSLSYLPTVLFVFSSFYFSYFFSIKGKFDHRFLRPYFYLYTLISLIVFFSIFSSKLNMLSAEFYLQSNNSAYLILSAMLFAWFCFKKNSIKLIFILIPLFSFLIFTFKRGAIIIGTLLILVILFEWVVNRYSWKRAAIILLILGLPALFFVIYYLASNINQILYFQRFTQSGGSLRDILYVSIFHAWYMSEPIHLLFGHGFFSAPLITAQATGTGLNLWAHSDFIEILYDHGLIGLSLYFFIIVNFYFHSLFVFKFNRDFFFLYLFLVSYWLMKAAFSGFYVDKSSFLIMLLIGFILGQASFNKRSV